MVLRWIGICKPIEMNLMNSCKMSGAVVSTIISQQGGSFIDLRAFQGLLPVFCMDIPGALLHPQSKDMHVMLTGESLAICVRCENVGKLTSNL